VIKEWTIILECIIVQLCQCGNVSVPSPSEFNSECWLFNW